MQFSASVFASTLQRWIRPSPKARSPSPLNKCTKASETNLDPYFRFDGRLLPILIRRRARPGSDVLFSGVGARRAYTIHPCIIWNRQELRAVSPLASNRNHPTEQVGAPLRAKR